MAGPAAADDAGAGHNDAAATEGGQNSNNNNNNNSTVVKERDIWRDSLVRYFGYANEVGEAVRPVAPRLVIPSYVVSIAYVMGDTRDKGIKARARGKPVFPAAADTMIWQALASVIVPGFTINRIVKFAGNALRNPSFAKLPPATRKFLPTAIGISVIPLIIHPIDHLVHYTMDRTIRPWWLHTPIHTK